MRWEELTSDEFAMADGLAAFIRRVKNDTAAELTEEFFRREAETGK